MSHESFSLTNKIVTIGISGVPLFAKYQSHGFADNAESPLCFNLHANSYSKIWFSQETHASEMGKCKHDKIPTAMQHDAVLVFCYQTLMDPPADCIPGRPINTSGG